MKTHAIVTGRVQGVGYRVWAAKQAQRAGLYGWVRNLQSGQVEVIVSGEQGSIDTFILALHKGPVFAKVEQVTSQHVEDSSDMSCFEILETAPQPEY